MVKSASPTRLGVQDSRTRRRPVGKPVLGHVDRSLVPGVTRRLIASRQASIGRRERLIGGAADRRFSEGRGRTCPEPDERFGRLPVETSGANAAPVPLARSETDSLITAQTTPGGLRNPTVTPAVRYRDRTTLHPRDEP